MGYEESEQSVASGRPVDLFDIAMGLVHWRLTSAGYDIDYFYNDYESAPCKCSEIESSGEISNNAIELELPRGHALAVMCVAGPPEQIITLTKYRGHGNDYIKDYFGYFVNFKFNEKGIPIMIFESSSSNLPMSGGRRRAMRLCGHRLYGYRCGVNKESYRIDGIIDTIDGLTITASELGTIAVDEPAVYGDLTALPGCTYIASSSVASFTTPDRAFDNSATSHWESAAGLPQWIYCKWTVAQLIKKIRIYKLYSAAGIVAEYGIRYFRVAGSNNGTDWTTIDVAAWEGDCQYYDGEGGSDTEILNTMNSAWATVTLANTTEYTYYRIYIYANWGGTTVACPEIEMIEADNTMTQHQFGAGGEIIVGDAHRNIITHNGTGITIDRKFRADVIAGVPFTAYAGCSHTPECCREKFDNMPNYGGQQNLPVKNPYTGRDTLVS